MKTQVLVTGASGMLGAHLAARLVKDGYVVHIFLRSKKHPMLSGLPVVEHHGDLENEADVDVALRDCQLVFHVAGTVSYRNADKNRLYRSNVLGTRNVINAAVRNKIKRLVHTSSTAAVGWSKDPGTVLDESAEPDQELKRTPYSWTKYLSEKEVLSGVEQGLDAVIINPGTIYGPGDVKLNTGKGLLALAQGKILLAPPGGLSVVTVHDVVEGHLRALERGKRGERYILAAENLPYTEFLRRAAQVLNCPYPKKTIPPGFGPPLAVLARILETLWPASPLSLPSLWVLFRFRYHSADKARKELGWRPRFSLENVIQEAMQFYVDQTKRSH